MAFCRNCGTELTADEKYCHKCGAPAEADTIDVGDKWKDMTTITDTTASFDETDIRNNKVLALESYLGILVLFPIFGSKYSSFTRYHANQGLVLLIAQVAYALTQAIIVAFFRRLHPFLGLFFNVILSMGALAFTAAAVLGIINVCRGKAKNLPLIGKIRIIK